MSVLGLVALILAAVFALVVLVFFPNVGKTVQGMLGGTFILLLGLALVALLLIAITGFDVTPLLRKVALFQTGHRVVDFFALMPEDQYRVYDVLHRDTDGDGHEEWVVFYQFDLADGRSPYAGAVYDFDRGRPPVLFPYRLVPPDRDYLSEATVKLDFENITDVGGEEGVPELFVYGQVGEKSEKGDDIKLTTDLSIFRHVPNSFEWEFPRDEPRRYQVVGSFRGDGGITYDSKSKRVTVLNRAGYDRSQLAVESIYELDEGRGSYMSVANPQQLSAPASSRVVFAFGMPDDILDTPYPEKIVLGFYEMLATRRPDIDPREFLTGQALIEFDRGNLAYFGFGSASGDVSDMKVTQLSYSTDFEQLDPSITVLGEDPRFLSVSVAFDAKVGATSAGTSEPIHWLTTPVNGRWKIDRRL
jgi:hypothetical protein